ncbi:MAG: hypothetical protein BWY81_00692 [Firmicutes bacterium ADurb.Bin467]|nr:MAG: hypothetical protein BWY81_00692 [Firmicutes bacterium ADurb.Bin467]
MIVVASDSAMAFAIASVPLAKFGISNTPIGPFQTTVFADLTSLANSSIVLGPMSRPCQPSGISPDKQIIRSVSLSNSLPQTLSTGRSSFTPFAFALSRSSSARPSRSASKSEFPISPPVAFMNV